MEEEQEMEEKEEKEDISEKILDKCMPEDVDTEAKIKRMLE